MVVITLANGNEVVWEKKDATDFGYDGKMFYMLKEGKRVAFYNVDHVISIVVKEDQEEKL